MFGYDSSCPPCGEHKTQTSTPTPPTLCEHVQYQNVRETLGRAASDIQRVDEIETMVCKLRQELLQKDEIIDKMKLEFEHMCTKVVARDELDHAVRMKEQFRQRNRELEQKVATWEDEKLRLQDELQGARVLLGEQSENIEENHNIRKRLKSYEEAMLKKIQGMQATAHNAINNQKTSLKKLQKQRLGAISKLQAPQMIMQMIHKLQNDKVFSKSNRANRVLREMMHRLQSKSQATALSAGGEAAQKSLLGNVDIFTNATSSSLTENDREALRNNLNDLQEVYEDEIDKMDDVQSLKSLNTLFEDVQRQRDNVLQQLDKQAMTQHFQNMKAQLEQERDAAIEALKDQHALDGVMRTLQEARDSVEDDVKALEMECHRLQHELDITQETLEEKEAELQEQIEINDEANISERECQEAFESVGAELEEIKAINVQLEEQRDGALQDLEDKRSQMTTLIDGLDAVEKTWSEEKSSLKRALIDKVEQLEKVQNVIDKIKEQYGFPKSTQTLDVLANASDLAMRLDQETDALDQLMAEYGVHNVRDLQLMIERDNQDLRASMKLMDVDPESRQSIHKLQKAISSQMDATGRLMEALSPLLVGYQVDSVPELVQKVLSDQNAIQKLFSSQSAGGMQINSIEDLDEAMQQINKLLMAHGVDSIQDLENVMNQMSDENEQLNTLMTAYGVSTVLDLKSAVLDQLADHHKLKNLYPDYAVDPHHGTVEDFIEALLDERKAMRKSDDALMNMYNVNDLESLQKAIHKEHSTMRELMDELGVDNITDLKQAIFDNVSDQESLRGVVDKYGVKSIKDLVTAIRQEKDGLDGLCKEYGCASLDELVDKLSDLKVTTAAQQDEQRDEQQALRDELRDLKRKLDQKTNQLDALQKFMEQHGISLSNDGDLISALNALLDEQESQLAAAEAGASANRLSNAEISALEDLKQQLGCNDIVDFKTKIEKMQSDIDHFRNSLEAMRRRGRQFMNGIFRRESSMMQNLM